MQRVVNPQQRLVTVMGWSPAYVLFLCIFVVGVTVVFTVLTLYSKMYVDHPFQGSIVDDAFEAIRLMIRQSDSSPSFMRLPVELRLEIYRLVFDQPRIDYRIVECTNAPSQRDCHVVLLSSIRHRRIRSLLCTNRQCRQEAFEMFYDKCELILHGQEWTARRISTLLPRFLTQNIRTVRCSSILAPMLTRPRVFPSLAVFHLPLLKLRFYAPVRRLEDAVLEDTFWRAWKFWARLTTSPLELYGEWARMIRLIELKVMIGRARQRDIYKVSLRLRERCCARGDG